MTFEFIMKVMRQESASSNERQWASCLNSNRKGKKGRFGKNLERENFIIDWKTLREGQEEC